MSRDKLFHTGNARTSFKSWQMYVVRVAVSHSKRIEMGLRGIEMSKSYSGVYIKTGCAIIEMSRDNLFHAENAHKSF